MASEVVLITGYPSLQARRLLVQILLSEPDARVVLLVWHKLLPAAASALAELSDAQQSRVQLLEGDAAAIDMGLSGQEFRQLAGEVTRIHSIAHIGYLGAEEKLARRVNVRAAAEVVELGLACEQLHCIVHHSTAYVSGDRTGLVYEQDLQMQQGFVNPVHRTRMLAEQVLRDAMDRLPIAVVRPTMLVGDSLTGEADRFDGPYLMVMLVLGVPRDMPVPLPAGGDRPINIVPVDYVVKAAHHIGRSRKAAGRSYHLASPETLTTRDVFRLIAQAAGGRTTTQSLIPIQFASALLRAPGLEKLLQHPRAFMRQLATGARYDTRNAEKALGDDIVCPPLASYVGTWVTAVQRHLQQRRDALRAALPIDTTDPSETEDPSEAEAPSEANDSSETKDPS